MINNSILSDYQYGFGHGWSYTTQLLKVTDMWNEILNRGRAVDIVYQHFAYVFDIIPHICLITKLAQYRVLADISIGYNNFSLAESSDLV